MPTPPRAAQLATADNDAHAGVFAYGSRRGATFATVHLTDQNRWIVRDPETRKDYPFGSIDTATLAADAFNTLGAFVLLGLQPYVGSPSEHSVYGEPA